LFHKLRELQQIRHAEQGAAVPYDDFRIGNRKIRPLRRDRADPHFIDLQQQTLAVNVVTFAHTDELLPVEWMKRVRDAHKTRP
jgi:hypothetical protein